MLNYAIVGFGGLGKVHFAAMEEVVNKAGDVKLVALCDVEDSAFAGGAELNIGSTDSGLDLSAYKIYKDAEEMFDKEQPDFIVTALPTYLHGPIAVKALERGIHVFSEKPMAINEKQAKNMIEKAKQNNVRLMIGQCLRFWPEYIELKKIIDEKRYGKVIRATFSRLSRTPNWSWQDWMMDEEKSGAVILDLHVHDVDFINWAFGMPKSVQSFATAYKTPHDSILTVYEYEKDMEVTARAEWGFPQCHPFQASFSVKCENATVELNGGVMTVYHEDGGAEILDIPAGNAYANEVIDFVDCIRKGENSEINPPEASLSSMQIALAERKSADKGRKIKL